MNCGLIFNTAEKKIVVSSQTACEWSCVVMRGNITLNKYYGKLEENGSTDVRIFTYGTSEMFGEVECHFKHGNCSDIKRVSITTTPLPFFYLTNSKVFLFGNDTYSYVYLYYGTPSVNSEYALSPLKFTINDDDKTEFTYNGESMYETISFNNFELYDIILSDYNRALGCVEICIHSNTDEKFVDALTINIEQTSTYYQYETTKVVIDIRQDIAQNLPTLLTISPALIFLDSKNPKQKINVTSLYRGESSKYGFSLVKPTSKETKQITSYSNDVEEYLNDYSIEPYKNENLDLLQLITDKNASHFILDMAGREEFDENINDQIGYEIYVVNSADTSCYQRLEFFYDYIKDPNNFIEISEISGVYAYVSHEIENGRQKIYEATEDTNKIVFSGAISGQSSITLYFSKDEINLANEPNLAKYQDHIFAQYQENTNVVFKIKSIPEWWKILSQSEYVREVKKDDELLITLEDEIPNDENVYVTLENRLGSICSIFIKSDENIFNKNVYTFGFSDGDTVESNKEVMFREIQNPLHLKSVSLNEEIYYITTTYTLQNTATSITIPTIKYPDTINNSNAKIEIVNENFDILYNQNINKYFINYSSISINNSKKEKNDNIIYYFEGNDKTEITVSIPILTKFVPWNIINRGSGISFNIYKGEVNGSTKKCVLINDSIPTFFPTSTITYVNILKVLPRENEIQNGHIYLIPNTILNDVDDVSCVIFQQLKSYNDCHLYVNFKSNPVVTIVNKYGYNVILDNMINIPHNGFVEAFNSLNSATDSSKNLYLDIPRNKEQSMFYSTYVKKSDFLTEFNKNVDFYLATEIEPEPKIENFQSLYINCLEDNPNYTLYSGYTSTILDTQLKVSEEFIKAKQGNEIKKWKLENGFLEINGKQYFPNDPVYEISYSSEYGIFIYDNYVSEKSSYLYFAIYFNMIAKIEINNVVTEIQGTDGDYYAMIDTYYELMPKSIKLNNEIFKIGTDNSFIYTKNNTKHYCYQGSDSKWYVNLPSMDFELDNSATKIEIQGVKYYFNNDNSLTYKNIQYYPIITATIPSGFTFPLLQSVDGNGEDKDYYLILNDKKKSLNAENKINITPFLACDLTNSSSKNSVTLQGEMKVELINEPSRKYVFINWEEYSLIDNKLIYEGKEYGITTIQVIENEKTTNKEFVVINNLGYVVHTKPNSYYYIVNNDKYYYNKSSAFQIKQYKSDSGYVFKTDELYNKTFKFTIDTNNLMGSNMVIATIGSDNLILTDSYVTKDESIFPVKKNIFLDENDEIVSEEYVTVQSPIDAYSAITMFFYDDTVLLSDNPDFNQNISANTEFSKTISGDVKVTINDYSEVKFENKCAFKFNNDCKIIIQKTSGGTEYDYQFYKNEILYINELEYKIIFTDVVTITFLHISQTPKNLNINVFKNIAVDSKNNEIYYSSLINDQDAIVYNKNIYYIFNGKVVVTDKDNGDSKTFNVYDKYVFIKQLTSILDNNDNYIPSINVLYSSEVSHILVNSNEKTYGYVNNNQIVILPKESYKDIKWSIYLPYYDISTKKLNLQTYTINNVKNYSLNSNSVNYDICTIKNYNNLSITGSTKDINVENGKFKIQIDCYEVNVLDASGNTHSTYYTNENRENKFTMKINNTNYTFSIWDYYANAYLRQSPMYLYELKTVDVKKHLTINDVVLNVDTYLYFQTGKNLQDYLKIYAVKWQSINPEQTSISLNYWDMDNNTIKSKTFPICKKTIIENSNLLTINIGDISLVQNAFTNVQTEKTYVQGYKLFYTTASTESAKEYEIHQNTGTMFLIFNTYEVNINGIICYGRTPSILRNEVEVLFYQNYDVTLTDNNTKICLTPHNNTYLNEKDEIQRASSHSTYDDNNESYDFYCFYNNKAYNVNSGIVTIPKKQKVIINGNKILLLYDIYSSLMFNMHANLTDEMFGDIKKVTFSSRIETPHMKKLLMSVKYKNEENVEETKYGGCVLDFK